MRKRTNPEKIPKARGRLAAHVQGLVLNRPAGLSVVALGEQTGISVNWLNKFAHGKIPSPSPEKLELLYEFFHKKELDL